MTATDPPEVVCLRCKRPVKTAVSRARRIGAGCWRILRAEARARQAPVALPGLAGLARQPTVQTGPDILDTAPVGGEQTAPAAAAGPCDDCDSLPVCAAAVVCARAAR